MRFTFRFLFVILGLLVISSCGDLLTSKSNDELSKSGNSTPGIHIQEILKRGKLVAITSNDPTSYFIYRGKPMGYEYELLSDFAKYLGVQLEVKIISSIPEAIDSLKSHKADILASGLTILGKRKTELDFSSALIKTHQILIQRIPDDLLNSSEATLDKNLLRDVTELSGKTIYVENGSSYYTRLINLEEEIGGDIDIVTYSGNIDIDSVMSLVSSGKIDYAISEEYTASFFLKYYDNIDIETPISLNQNIGWAIPKNSVTLMDTINYWIQKNQNSTRWAVIYSKYFKHNNKMNQRINSAYTLRNGVISPYDNIIKTNAKIIGWNWKLLAAQIKVESGFNNSVESWAGAKGLMQIMPSTLEGLNGDTSIINSPSHNIALGAKYDKILFDYWISVVPDTIQAIKFSLASYNIGKGHIYDAQRLAEKYDLSPIIWDNHVALMVKKLSKPDYYRDPVVRNGYCRGTEAYNYVFKVFDLYTHYNNFETP